MEKGLFYTIFTISFVLARAKDEDLPLCPTNFQYFPQNLPMHCRMPTGADFPGYPRMPGFPTGAPPANDKQPMSMPAPIPGMPVPMPMPGAIPMPGPMMPMPMPMPGPAPGQKLPVIVMPFYSPDTSFKKPDRPRKPEGPGWKKPKRPHESAESSDTDTSSDTSDTDTDSSSENGWWKGKKHGWRRNGRRTSKKRHSHSHRSKRRHNKKNKDLLTPVLQYVTNDGYVIYEKTISKGEAKDWLKVNKEEYRQEEHNEGQNNEDLDASVHVDGNAEVVEIKRNKSEEDKDEVEEKGKEEVTTPQNHERRHHRKANAPAINKLLPKRAF